MKTEIQGLQRSGGFPVPKKSLHLVRQNPSTIILKIDFKTMSEDDEKLLNGAIFGQRPLEGILNAEISNGIGVNVRVSLIYSVNSKAADWITSFVRERYPPLTDRRGERERR